MRNDAFSRCHPAVIFILFTAVILLGAFLRHPICTVVLFFSGIVYALYLDPRSTGKLLVTFCLPVFLFTALINPLFNHRGTIILARFPTGNALTLESIVYGAFSALMLSALILWFSAFSRLFTSEKTVWLAGRAFPTLSLLLSMTLHFVPEFRRRFVAVNKIRKSQCETAGSNKPVVGSVRALLSVFSTVVTWSLENAIVSSDSMRARGYGLDGRTSYSPYRVMPTDLLCILIVGATTVIIIVLNVLGALDWHFYPSFGGNIEADALIAGTAYSFLCFLPLLIDGKEAAKWRFLRSGI